MLIDLQSDSKEHQAAEKGTKRTREQVRHKLNGSMPQTTDDLLNTDVTAWAANPIYTEVKDVRDQKELVFLSKCLNELSSDRLPALADMIVQRVREVRVAKKDGSSWDKAAGVSLLAQTSAPSARLLRRSKKKTRRANGQRYVSLHTKHLRRLLSANVQVNTIENSRTLSLHHTRLY